MNLAWYVCFLFTRRFVAGVFSDIMDGDMLYIPFALRRISIREFDLGSTREAESGCKVLQRELGDRENIFVFMQVHRADVGDECLNKKFERSLSRLLMICSTYSLAEILDLWTLEAKVL